MALQVRAREETLANGEQRHQQLKEESKKQVTCLSSGVACFLWCVHPTDCHRTQHDVQCNSQGCASHFSLNSCSETRDYAS